MSNNIVEENPAQQSNTPSGPQGQGAGGGQDKIRKQARQLAYDVRYKVKQGFKDGQKTDPASLKRAFVSQLGKSPAPGPVKLLAKKMLIGEEYDFIDISETVDNVVSNTVKRIFTKVTKLEDANGNPAFEVTDVVSEEIGERKYKIRVKDKKTGKSYVRMADRPKISELRKNPNIASVEMTGYGSPYEGEKKKGSSTAAVKSGKGLAKKDYDGDGKLESPTAEYKGSKDKAIKKAVAKEEVEVVDEANKGERVADRYRAGKLSSRPVGKRASKKSRTTAWTTADVGQRNRNRFGDGKERKLNKFGSDYKRDSESKDGLRSTSSDHAQKQRRAEHEARRGKKTKGVKEELDPVVQSALDSLNLLDERLGGKGQAYVLNKEHHQTDANGKVIEHGDGTPSSVEEAKKKGLDGKECWDGYKLAGTKKKGGKTVDDCVKVKEDFIGEVNSENENPNSNNKKIDVMKGKNTIKINPNQSEQVEAMGKPQEMEKPKEDSKEKRIRLMKRMILQKKTQAVRSGAGADIVAHNELEGNVVEDAEYGYDKEGKSLNPKDKDPKTGETDDKPLGSVEFDGGAVIKPIGDPREMPTAINLIRNKLRARGMKL